MKISLHFYLETKHILPILTENIDILQFFIAKVEYVKLDDHEKEEFKSQIIDGFIERTRFVQYDDKYLMKVLELMEKSDLRLIFSTALIHG